MFLFSVSLPTVDSVRHFTLSQYSEYVMLFHCSFNIYYPDYTWNYVFDVCWLVKLFLYKWLFNLSTVVTQSCLTLCDPRGLQHTRLPCPSPTPRACSNSCPSNWSCHPIISSSVIFFSCLQSFPASGSFQISQLFTSGGQSTGVSASTSVLPTNTQDWSPLGWTGWISLQSKGLSRVFSNTTVQKHQFFSAQLSL